MKKSLLFLALFIFSAVGSISQELTSYSAKAGYDFLITENPTLVSDAELVMVSAYSIPETFMIVDVLTGDASVWTYSFKSKVATDPVFYMYIVFNFEGMFTFQSSENTDVDAQQLVALPENWADSKTVAVSVNKNSEYLKFRTENATNLYAEMAQIMVEPNLMIPGWMVGSVLFDETAYVCVYDGVSAELLMCDAPTSVKDAQDAVIAAYPNPAGDFTTLEIPFEGRTEIEIFSLDGSSLKKVESFGQEKVTISTSDLNPGVYNAVIRNGSGLKHKLIVVSR